MICVGRPPVVCAATRSAGSNAVWNPSGAPITATTPSVNGVPSPSRRVTFSPTPRPSSPASFSGSATVSPRRSARLPRRVLVASVDSTPWASTPCTVSPSSLTDDAYWSVRNAVLVTNSDAAATPGTCRTCSTTSGVNPPIEEVSTASARRFSV